MPWFARGIAVAGDYAYIVDGHEGIRVMNIKDPEDIIHIADYDTPGYARSPSGVWQRKYDQYTLYSFQPEVLAAVAPQIRLEQAQRPAQARLHVDDVSRARMVPFLNKLAYQRTRQTSLGNLRLMHTLGQQLHVPVEDFFADGSR